MRALWRARRQGELTAVPAAEVVHLLAELGVQDDALQDPDDKVEAGVLVCGGGCLRAVGTERGAGNEAKEVEGAPTPQDAKRTRHIDLRNGVC